MSKSRSEISAFVALPCLDSPETAATRKRELDISRDRAAMLGLSAVEVAKTGYYLNQASEKVDIRAQIRNACAAKRSIAPDDPLPNPKPVLAAATTRIQVINETTLQAAWQLVQRGFAPIALNFANGIHPGGAFLYGARAQEEVLCRSSILYATLVEDPMYKHHRKRPRADSTDWAILSPNVPVFRNDEGSELDRPWCLSFLTCAAPYMPDIGQPESGDLLSRRIRRVLAIANAYGYSALVLGAWGCGAFGNDPQRTAADFRKALTTEFRRAFSEIVFAITDWSPERRFLGPFRDAFAMNHLSEDTCSAIRIAYLRSLCRPFPRLHVGGHRTQITLPNLCRTSRLHKYEF